MRKLLATALLGVMMSTVGCFGSMNASGRLKTWNREIENRWMGQGAYILLRFPLGGVYGLLFLSDVFVLNSIEFWGGTNPIDPVSPERRQRLRELGAQRQSSSNE